MLLFLLSALQADIAVPLFEIPRLTPGITVIGLSVLTLFSATLLARDRETALLQRLYTTPLTASDFILGYLLPVLPMALGQTMLCYLCAIPLGLKFSIHTHWAILGVVPVSVFYISLGLLCGSLFGVKQVGGLCGALLTNLSAWLSGIWFDLSLVGGVYEKIAHALPFFHAVELEKALCAGELRTAAGHMLPVLVYSLLTAAAAGYCFLRQMNDQ